jgi:hypothetical protein
MPLQLHRLIRPKGMRLFPSSVPRNKRNGGHVYLYFGSASVMQNRLQRNNLTQIPTVFGIQSCKRMVLCFSSAKWPINQAVKKNNFNRSPYG